MSETQVPARNVELVRNGNVIAEVNNISGPGFTLGLEDSTALGQESWDSVVPTILSGGTLDFDLGFKIRDAEHGFGGIANSGLGSDLTSRTLQSFVLRIPGATAGFMMVEWSFSAYVQSFTPNFSNPGKVTASVSLRIVGQPSLS